MHGSAKIFPATSSSAGTSSKIRSVAYWIFTLLVVYEMTAGSLWDLLRIEYVRVVLAHLGYPTAHDYGRLEASLCHGPACAGASAAQGVGLRWSVLPLHRGCCFALLGRGPRRQVDHAAGSCGVHRCVVGFALASAAAFQRGFSTAYTPPFVDRSRPDSRRAADPGVRFPAQRSSARVRLSG